MAKCNGGDDDHLEEILGQLVKMASQPEKWTIQSTHPINQRNNQRKP
ncbi:hypothetical protein PJF56_14080 [Roseofilum sp. BLCC_M91]|uniref:Uncharacterized protein n=1 Tax=Roseofilum halophilum BLCC-M91 TaxID=3022259 RepID=A0ABT7BNX7_9CYAN|nr:hypothetical protein [Roseofilum halophilum]MDJ1179993.1 hypothetical protein [Roseofilum halophilum BLCC-M91]